MKRVRFALLSSVAIAVASSLGAPQAQAQFVCGGSATGAEPQTGAGATAAGGTNNVACGTNANASGTSGSNTATGDAANASGNLVASPGGNIASQNVASGFQANARAASTPRPEAMPMPAATSTGRS